MSNTKPSLNFGYLYFKPLLNLDISKTRFCKFESKSKILQQIWKSSIEHNISPVDFIKSDLTLSKYNELYDTGYKNLRLTKAQAFDLVKLLLNDYQGELDPVIFFYGTRAKKTEIFTDEIEEFDFHAFISFFLGFGLNLNENKKLLQEYCLKIGLACDLNDQVNITGESYLEHKNYFVEATINEPALLNDLFIKARSERLSNVEVQYPEEVADLIVRTVRNTNKGASIFSNILGITSNQLRGKQLRTYSTFLLERFVTYFDVTESQIFDKNYFVKISPELTNLALDLDSKHCFLGVNTIVKNSELSEAFAPFYKLMLDIVGSIKLLKLGLNITSIARSVKQKASPVNFTYKFLSLLSVERNSALIKALIKYLTPDIANLTVAAEEQAEELVVEEDPLQQNFEPLENEQNEILGKLSAMPQAGAIIMSSAEHGKSNVNILEKFNPEIASLIKNKITTLPDGTQTRLSVAVQNLLTYGQFFDKRTVVTVSICNSEFVANSALLESTLHSLKNGAKYAYLVDCNNRVSFELISVVELNNNYFVEFYDTANNGFLKYRQELATFYKFYSYLNFPIITMFF